MHIKYKNLSISIIFCFFVQFVVPKKIQVRLSELLLLIFIRQSVCDERQLMQLFRTRFCCICACESDYFAIVLWRILPLYKDTFFWKMRFSWRWTALLHGLLRTFIWSKRSKTSSWTVLLCLYGCAAVLWVYQLQLSTRARCLTFWCFLA